jgi:hydroxypyruvate isomerase
MCFSVNLSTVFTEYPFLERFTKAKEAGFQYVECQFPYDFSIEKIKQTINQNQLELILLNLPPGDWAAGDRGLAAIPERVGEFKISVEQGISYAIALGVDKIHCMAGIQEDSAQAKETYIQNITYAAGKLAEHGITLLIEPINRQDMPGYFLSNLYEAIEFLEEIGLPNVKLQYDFYHMQKIHGNLISNFERNISKIGHLQIADVPGRNEPGTGEINYDNVVQAIKSSGYAGYVGLEYTPKGKSEDSFAWLKKGVQ